LRPQIGRGKHATAKRTIDGGKMIIDTNDSCLGRAADLRRMNVDTVGRYYRDKTHPSWKITKAEAQELSQAGIKIFMVFEDYGNAADLNLTTDQGKKDASSAVAQAQAIGQPEGSAIYFAVEGLPSGYKTGDLPRVRDYISGVKQIFGTKYAIGVYGDGIVCKTMLDEHYCRYILGYLPPPPHSKERKNSWQSGVGP
jgi:Domain of unknown function (DUF1906)